MITSIQTLDGKAAREIMYLPAGRSSVYASVNGLPQTLEVQVDAKSARLLQSDLQALLGAQVKPFIDFDFKAQAAAAAPRRFVWQPGAGLFLTLEWTRGGRAAVEGNDYRYFSPAFRVDAQGAILGLPANGAIGSLVNKASSPAGLGPQRKRVPVSASAISVGLAREVAPADPFGRMRAAREVISGYRRAHPKCSTDEVFRALKQQNPQLFKD